MKIFKELTEKGTGLFGGELPIREGPHISEDGFLRPRNHKGFLPYGYVDLRPAPGSSILLNRTESHDIVGTPVLPVAEMDHSVLLDLQGRLLHRFSANLGAWGLGANDTLAPVRKLH